MKPYSKWLVEQILNGNITDHLKFENAMLEREREQIKESELYKNKVCPKCERVRLYYRRSFKNWRCSKCFSVFSENMDYTGVENN